MPPRPLEHIYPSIDDLRIRAKKRIPHFVWEYLDSGTGGEVALTRNRAALDNVLFEPRAMAGHFHIDLATTFLGRDYTMPIGIAPVGSSGMIWPGGEMMLARTGATHRVPVGLSTVSTRLPEEIGPISGDFGWFQLYPLGGDGVQEEIARRAQEAGFTTLVLTVDVPVNSRRERQRRAGFNIPPRMTPAMIAQMLICPHWLLGIARYGKPAFRLMEDYVDSKSVADVAKRLGPDMRPNPDWSVIERLRTAWDGPLILKGIAHAEDAREAKARGIDAVWVSMHGGRQLDAGPAAIDVLPVIRQAVGDDYPLIWDTGVRSGLDVARALAQGADFVFAGRAFYYGLGALGEKGAAHVLYILAEDLRNVMYQMGLRDFSDLRGRAIHAPTVGVSA